MQSNHLILKNFQRSSVRISDKLYGVRRLPSRHTVTSRAGGGIIGI